MSRDKIVRTEFQENREEKVKILTRLTKEQEDKLKDLRDGVYRGISNSHTIRCLIEDRWEEWSKERRIEDGT